MRLQKKDWIRLGVAALCVAGIAAVALLLFGRGKPAVPKAGMAPMPYAENRALESLRAAKLPGADTLSGVLFLRSLSEGLSLLRGGRAAFLALPSETAAYAALEDGLRAHPGETPASVHMVVKESGEGLLLQVNKALMELMQSGALSEIQSALSGAAQGERTALVEMPVFADADTVRVGYTGGWPPFDMESEDKRPAGLCATLLYAMAEGMGVNFEMVRLEGDGYRALEEGEIDLLPFVAVTPYDEKFFGDTYLLSHPYHDTRLDQVLREGP